MATSWHSFLGESWQDYLSRSSMTDDLTAALRQSSREMVGAISGQTAAILAGVNAGADRMADGLERIGGGMEALGDQMGQGFDILSGQMDMVAGHIEELNATFTWGFGQMLASLGGMADSLKDLIKIAKTPAQTAAYEQFEIARDAFRQNLYAECLEALDKATNGDHTSPGYKLEWRFHRLAGVVRLGFFGCDMGLVDPAQAEQAFLLAARYAKTDHKPEAATALLQAGWSAYVQQKLPESLTHTEQAMALDPKLAEAFFQAAKIQMAAGAPGQALPVLRQAIDKSADYIVKAAADGDFKRFENDLNGFFAAMQQEGTDRLAPKVKRALEEAEHWAQTVSEVAACREILGRWRSLVAGRWGLLELLRYDQGGFDRDRDTVSKAQAQGKARLQREEAERRAAKRNTWRVETRTVAVEREVEETYQIEGKGWFRTKMVTKTRKVRRPVAEPSSVIVNDLGEHLDQMAPVRCKPEHFKFAMIPAGTFVMGSPAGETGRSGDETQHTVTISRPFLMLVYPVTQSLWEAVMGSNPSHFKGPDLPVESVSWDDCQEFIGRLNQNEGTGGFRLPTEAEWEYACRAGTTGPRYGDLDHIAWHAGNSGSKTHPVGQKTPNVWGLYDMIGNVWEWCQDWYGDYPSLAVADPSGPSSGSARVYRGGS